MERIKFDKSELNPKRWLPSPRPEMPPTPVFSTPVTPKENFRALLRGERPLWMPSMRDYQNLTPRINPDNVARSFVMDGEAFDPMAGGGPDMFGIEWEYVPTVGGSMVRPGDPKVPDVCRWEEYIQFPDLDAWDWAGAKKRLEGYHDPELALCATILNGFFERLISFAGTEGALLALVLEDEKEAVHRLFDRLCGLYIDMIGRYKEYFDIDILCLHDDWGSQRAPFFSLDTCREMTAPYVKRVGEAVHALGLGFELHSCGKNELLVPAMIEAGVDMWSGQDMNDYAAMYEKYGDKIHLGASPRLTPEMTEPEYKAAIDAFVERFTKNGAGYVGMAMLTPEQSAYLYEKSRRVLGG